MNSIKIPFPLVLALILAVSRSGFAQPAPRSQDSEPEATCIAYVNVYSWPATITQRDRLPKDPLFTSSPLIQTPLVPESAGNASGQSWDQPQPYFTRYDVYSELGVSKVSSALPFPAGWVLAAAFPPGRPTYPSPARQPNPASPTFPYVQAQRYDSQPQNILFIKPLGLSSSGDSSSGGPGAGAGPDDGSLASASGWGQWGSGEESDTASPRASGPANNADASSLAFFQRGAAASALLVGQYPPAAGGGSGAEGLGKRKGPDAAPLAAPVPEALSFNYASCRRVGQVLGPRSGRSQLEYTGADVAAYAAASAPSAARSGTGQGGGGGGAADMGGSGPMGTSPLGPLSSLYGLPYGVGQSQTADWEGGAPQSDTAAPPDPLDTAGKAMVAESVVLMSGPGPAGDARPPHPTSVLLRVRSQLPYLIPVGQVHVAYYFDPDLQSDTSASDAAQAARRGAAQRTAMAFRCLECSLGCAAVSSEILPATPALRGASRALSLSFRPPRALFFAAAPGAQGQASGGMQGGYGSLQPGQGWDGSQGGMGMGGGGSAAWGQGGQAGSGTAGGLQTGYDETNAYPGFQDISVKEVVLRFALVPLDSAAGAAGAASPSRPLPLRPVSSYRSDYSGVNRLSTFGGVLQAAPDVLRGGLLKNPMWPSLTEPNPTAAVWVQGQLAWGQPAGPFFRWLERQRVDQMINETDTRGQGPDAKGPPGPEAAAAAAGNVSGPVVPPATPAAPVFCASPSDPLSCLTLDVFCCDAMSGKPLSAVPARPREIPLYVGPRQISGPAASLLGPWGRDIYALLPLVGVCVVGGSVGWCGRVRRGYKGPFQLFVPLRGPPSRAKGSPTGPRRPKAHASEVEGGHVEDDEDHSIGYGLNVPASPLRRRLGAQLAAAAAEAPGALGLTSGALSRRLYKDGSGFTIDMRPVSVRGVRRMDSGAAPQAAALGASFSAAAAAGSISVLHSVQSQGLTGAAGAVPSQGQLSLSQAHAQLQRIQLHLGFGTGQGSVLGVGSEASPGAAGPGSVSDLSALPFLANAAGSGLVEVSPSNIASALARSSSWRNLGLEPAPPAGNESFGAGGVSLLRTFGVDASFEAAGMMHPNPLFSRYTYAGSGGPGGPGDSVEGLALPGSQPGFHRSRSTGGLAEGALASGVLPGSFSAGLNRLASILEGPEAMSLQSRASGSPTFSPQGFRPRRQGSEEESPCRGFGAAYGSPNAQSGPDSSSGPTPTLRVRDRSTSRSGPRRAARMLYRDRSMSDPEPGSASSLSLASVITLWGMEGGAGTAGAALEPSSDAIARGGALGAGTAGQRVRLQRGRSVPLSIRPGGVLLPPKGHAAGTGHEGCSGAGRTSEVLPTQPHDPCLEGDWGAAAEGSEGPLLLRRTLSEPPTSPLTHPFEGRADVAPSAAVQRVHQAGVLLPAAGHESEPEPASPFKPESGLDDPLPAEPVPVVIVKDVRGISAFLPPHAPTSSLLRPRPRSFGGAFGHSRDASSSADAAGPIGGNSGAASAVARAHSFPSLARYRPGPEPAAAASDAEAGMNASGASGAHVSIHVAPTTPPRPHTTGHLETLAACRTAAEPEASEGTALDSAHPDPHSDLADRVRPEDGAAGAAAAELESHVVSIHSSPEAPTVPEDLQKSLGLLEQVAASFAADRRGDELELGGHRREAESEAEEGLGALGPSSGYASEARISGDRVAVSDLPRSQSEGPPSAFAGRPGSDLRDHGSATDTAAGHASASASEASEPGPGTMSEEEAGSSRAESRGGQARSSLDIVSANVGQPLFRAATVGPIGHVSSRGAATGVARTAARSQVPLPPLPPRTASAASSANTYTAASVSQGASLQRGHSRVNSLALTPKSAAVAAAVPTGLSGSSGAEGRGSAAASASASSSASSGLGSGGTGARGLAPAAPNIDPPSRGSLLGAGSAARSASTTLSGAPTAFFSAASSVGSNTRVESLAGSTPSLGSGTLSGPPDQPDHSQLQALSSTAQNDAEGPSGLAKSAKMGQVGQEQFQPMPAVRPSKPKPSDDVGLPLAPPEIREGLDRLLRQSKLQPGSGSGSIIFAGPGHASGPGSRAEPGSGRASRAPSLQELGLGTGTDFSEIQPAPLMLSRSGRASSMRRGSSGGDPGSRAGPAPAESSDLTRAPAAVPAAGFRRSTDGPTAQAPGSGSGRGSRAHSRSASRDRQSRQGSSGCAAVGAAAATSAEGAFPWGLAALMGATPAAAATAAPLSQARQGTSTAGGSRQGSRQGSLNLSLSQAAGPSGAESVANAGTGAAGTGLLDSEAQDPRLREQGQFSGALPPADPLAAMGPTSSAALSVPPRSAGSSSVFGSATGALRSLTSSLRRMTGWMNPGPIPQDAAPSSGAEPDAAYVGGPKPPTDGPTFGSAQASQVTVAAAPSSAAAPASTVTSSVRAGPAGLTGPAARASVTPVPLALVPVPIAPVPATLLAPVTSGPPKHASTTAVIPDQDAGGAGLSSAQPQAAGSGVGAGPSRTRSGLGQALGGLFRQGSMLSLSLAGGGGGGTLFTGGAGPGPAGRVAPRDQGRAQSQLQNQAQALTPSTGAISTPSTGQGQGPGVSGAGAAEDGSLPAPPGTPGPSNSSLLRLPPLIDPADVESATPLLISVSDVTLGSMLGRGAFGAVFRGTWQGKEVAVKVLNVCSGVNVQELHESFRRELRLLVTCRHPHIVRCFGGCVDLGVGATGAAGSSTGEQGGPGGGLGTPCIVEELVQGGSLYGLLHPRHGPPSPLPYVRLLELLGEIASALAYLHPRVVHRDLKPQNVLLTTSGHAKLVDFGLSRLAGPDVSYLEASGITGTPYYLAPEILTGKRVTEKADVFALGIIIWEMYTGRKPYEDKGFGWRAQYLVMHDVSQGLRPELPRDCPPALRRLCLRCWDTDPALRPSALDVARRVQGLLAEHRKLNR